MRIQWLNETRRRCCSTVLISGLSLLSACTGPIGSTSDSSRAGSGVRFALEVREGAHPPVFVYVNTESQPVGWLGVLQNGVRIALEPRCDIQDCGRPGAVCGAAVPLVRRIADRNAAGRIEYAWDGTTSTIEEVGACERRVMAPEGQYSARFCYSHEADIEGGGGGAPEGAVMGQLPELTCVERAFRLGRDAEVVLILP